MMRPTGNVEERLLGADFVRAAACLIVLFHHLAQRMTLMSHSQKILLLALIALAGCSKEATPPPPAAAPVSNIALVEPGAIDAPAVQADEFSGSFAPGGVAANYRATFSGGQIKSLQETRPAAGGERRGVYEFHGARLLKYDGAALGSADELQLEFSEQGKMLVARAGAGTASDEEISAIRDRAQSLRSHAVSQRAVRGHEKAGQPKN